MTANLRTALKILFFPVTLIFTSCLAVASFICYWTWRLYKWAYMEDWRS